MAGIDTINKDVVNTLSGEQGAGSNFNKSNIMYDEKVRGVDLGLDRVVAAIDNRIRIERDKEKIEKNEREISDKMRGEIAERAGMELPADSNEATKTAYRATAHMKNIDTAAKKALDVFDTDEFQELSEDKRKESKSVLLKALGDSLASAELEDNIGSQKFVVAQMRQVEAAYAMAEHTYKNSTLPTRTIGNITDLLIKSDADTATWESSLASMKSKDVVGSMPSAELTKVIYGEVTRAIDSGNLAAHAALKASDTWKDMSASQKLNIDQAFERELTAQNTQLVSDVSDAYKSLITDTLADGDISRLDEVTAGLEKMPPKLRNAVFDKIRPSLDKVQPTRIAINKLWLRESGDLDVRMDSDEADIAIEYMTREAMNDGGGELSSQEAGQIAALRAAHIGVFSEATHEAFNVDPTFVDGVIDGQSRGAIIGGNRLLAAGVSTRDARKIMGDANFDVLIQAREFLKQGLPIDVAVSRTLEHKQAYDDSTQFEKAEKALSALTVVDQSGFIDRFVDGVAGVFSAVQGLSVASGLTPFVPVEAVLTGKAIVGAEGDFKQEVQNKTPKLRRQANIGETTGDMEDGLTPKAAKTIGLRNKNEAILGYLEYQKRFPSQPAKLQMAGYKDFLENDAVISNGSLLVDDRLIDKIKSIGMSSKRSNEALSLTMQALTPLMGLSRTTQTAIQDTMLKVQVLNSNGDYEVVDDEEARRAALAEHARNPSDAVFVSLDRAVYESLYNEGGKLRNGKSIPPIRSAITKLAGAWDTRKWANDFIQHTLDYDADTGTFVAAGIDRKGERLTVDRSFVKETKNDSGVSEIITNIDQGTPLVGIFPEEFVFEFMKTYIRQDD